MGKADNACPICGRDKGRNKNACCHACHSALRSNKKACAVCGRLYLCSPANNVKTCSPECRIKYKALSVEKSRDKYLQSLDGAHEAFERSPICQRDENNFHAKAWVIQSPDGKTYECRNLLSFIRENPEMFDGTAKQAWDGLTKIKYSMQGKRKRPVSQWKGWRLVEFGD